MTAAGGPTGSRPRWPGWPQAQDRAAVVARLEQVLDSGVWTVRSVGPRPCLTELAEEAWARECGVPHAVAVSSGSTALEVALRALGVGPGDEVVVPALGWYATTAAVVRAGAAPVFADVDAATSCIDPAAVEALAGPRTAAVVAVHLHCAAADLTALSAVCSRRGLALVEDCAQAHGMAWRDRPVGSYGVVSCSSFNQEKLLPAGELGMVTTADEALARRAHALRSDGYLPPRGAVRAFDAAAGTTGGNAAPSEFAAAVLLDQLAAFERLQARRTRQATATERLLEPLDWARPLAPGCGTTRRSWYEFGVVLDLARFGGRTVADVGAAVSERLGAPVHPTDAPVTDVELLGPLPRPPAPPAARELAGRLLVFHHRLLLSPALPEAFVEALDAARRCS